MIRTVTVSIAVLTLVGCVRVGSADHFQKSAVERAAFDLQCDASNIVATDLGKHQVGVRGCNRQGVYLYEPHNNIWVNNSAAPASTK